MDRFMCPSLQPFNQVYNLIAYNHSNKVSILPYKLTVHHLLILC